MVARLPDGSWSAPSAIATAGAGFGGQIGFELTDFVFILNDASAVKTFSQAGSLTLGGNVSVAAGPVGRNAEAAGAASLRSVAGIFSYSKTKGLFAGVSLEGSAIIERKDANTKLYGRPVSAKELLTGTERSPPQAAPLLNILNSRVFNGTSQGSMDDRMYNDIPVYDNSHDSVIWGNKTGSAYGEGQSREGDTSESGQSHDEFGRPKRASTWRDDTYEPARFGSGSRSNTYNDVPTGSRGFDDGGSKAGGPGRPSAPKPNFASKQNLLKKNEAVALFTFEADQPGDLAFKKGDVITVLKKTESDNDWWYVVSLRLSPGKYEQYLPVLQDRHGRWKKRHLPQQLCQDEGVTGLVALFVGHDLTALGGGNRGLWGMVFMHWAGLRNSAVDSANQPLWMKSRLKMAEPFHGERG